MEWIAEDRLAVEVHPEPVRLPDWLRRAVDRHWEAEVAEHPRFFRGPVLTVATAVQEAGRLQVLAQFTDYAHYLFGRHLPSGDRWRVRPVFAVACPLTAEGHLVVAQMSEETARPLWVQAIGGAATPEDVAGGRFLPVPAASRAVVAALGLDLEHDLKRPPAFVGAVWDPTGPLALAVRFDLIAPWEDVERSARARREAAEAGKPSDWARLLALPWGEAGLEVLRSAQWEVAPYLPALLAQEALRRAL
ncbi:MAG: hypothetical protein K6U14_01410 [Firmicutes bacterium]|nr:hypothetical protein [Alicyclobacillaceae bacterium]MCL6496277.1 hypothetical protein [Bacillota bacterium]